MVGIKKPKKNLIIYFLYYFCLMLFSTFGLFYLIFSPMEMVVVPSITPPPFRLMETHFFHLSQKMQIDI